MGLFSSKPLHPPYHHDQNSFLSNPNSTKHVHITSSASPPSSNVGLSQDLRTKVIYEGYDNQVIIGNRCQLCLLATTTSSGEKTLASQDPAADHHHRTNDACSSSTITTTFTATESQVPGDDFFRKLGIYVKTKGNRLARSAQVMVMDYYQYDRRECKFIRKKKLDHKRAKVTANLPTIVRTNPKSPPPHPAKPRIDMMARLSPNAHLDAEPTKEAEDRKNDETTDGYERGPAERSGQIRPGDILYAINGMIITNKTRRQTTRELQQLMDERRFPIVLLFKHTMDMEKVTHGNEKPLPPPGGQYYAPNDDPEPCRNSSKYFSVSI